MDLSSVRMRKKIQNTEKPGCELRSGNHLRSTNLHTVQKQPPRGVLKKRCSENMQEIYRRTRMSKCDFNKLQNNFIEIASEWVSSYNFAAYFQNIFSQEHLWVAASVLAVSHQQIYGLKFGIYFQRKINASKGLDTLKVR